MTSVLAQRQLNAAGQLFTLSDYDVITDLVRYPLDLRVFSRFGAFYRFFFVKFSRT